MDIKELLAFSLNHNASDLHLCAGIVPMMRVDGEMKKLPLPELTAQQVQQLVNEVMNESLQKSLKEQLEVDFATQFEGLGRFRVNVFMQSRGLSAVFRTIAEQVPSLEQINAPKILKSFADFSHGLVLVTGPTGSGKSTTLAALLDKINTDKAQHILTIEDPIEFVHKAKKSLINQREVNKNTHSFHRALKSALREDPDVILIGELRDKESISLALTAAETGHLVFATLHTSSAPKTVDRIVDVFPGSEKTMIRSMLSGSLRAVVYQQLLKKQTAGRVAAHEIMLVNTAIANLIKEDKVAQMKSIMQTAGSQGMQTMEQAMQRLALQGEIELNESPH